MAQSIIRMLLRSANRNNLNLVHKRFAIKFPTIISIKPEKTQDYSFQFMDVDESAQNKRTFLEIVKSYKENHRKQENVVEFIYAALQWMKHFQVNKDYESYMALIKLFPDDGTYRAKSVWQMELRHCPKHQDAAISVLVFMEANGLFPMTEDAKYIERVFGQWTHPVRKVKRMLYWLPKFRYVNPLRYDPIKPHKLSISDQRWVASHPQHITKLIELMDCLRQIAIDCNIRILPYPNSNSFIVSSQNIHQRTLLTWPDGTLRSGLTLQGPFYHYYAQKSYQYYVLKAESNPELLAKKKVYVESCEEFTNPNVSQLRHCLMPRTNKKTRELPQSALVHEQPDGMICALVMISDDEANDPKTKRQMITYWLRNSSHSGISNETCVTLFS
ncbi:hypothetical protein GJ496_005682 [Pomphorhynchus laevis]|nr:hypothetical protein GJ496_005682 [Pomphorhynchus laevis]